MKIKIIVLLAVCAVITLSFTARSAKTIAKKNQETFSAANATESVGGLPSEDPIK